MTLNGLFYPLWFNADVALSHSRGTVLQEPLNKGNVITIVFVCSIFISADRDMLIDKENKACYAKIKLIMRSSAADIVWTQRRIVNPVRARNGTATVCVEAPHATKVSHWELS